MGKSEESMPRKSKHGKDIARWGHHEEMKEDRRKGRNKSKQKWKKEVQKESCVKSWVTKQCKFANELASKEEDWRLIAKKEFDTALAKGVIDENIPDWAEASMFYPIGHVPGTDLVIVAHQYYDVDYSVGEPIMRDPVEWGWIAKRQYDGVGPDGIARSLPGQLESLAIKLSVKKNPQKPI
jgi:hypothetical protein